MNQKNENLSIAFSIVFMVYALRFAGDIEFFIYNLLAVKVDYMYVIVSVVIGLVIVAGVYRLYLRRTNNKSLFFVLGSLIINIYYLFFHGVVIDFLMSRNFQIFDEASTSPEVNLAYYIRGGIILLIHIVVIVLILKSVKNKNGDRSDPEIIDTEIK